MEKLYKCRTVVFTFGKTFNGTRFNRYFSRKQKWDQEVESMGIYLFLKIRKKCFPYWFELLNNGTNCFRTWGRLLTQEEDTPDRAFQERSRMRDPAPNDNCGPFPRRRPSRAPSPGHSVHAPRKLTCSATRRTQGPLFLAWFKPSLTCLRRGLLCPLLFV